MVHPNDIIAAKEASIAAQEQALAISKAELAGMRAMAQAMGGGANAKSAAARLIDTVARAGGSGRQPGAISQRWRKVLEVAILKEPEWIPAERYVAIIKLVEGRDTTPSQVRHTFKGYENHGFVESDNLGRYRVTEMAREKFGFANGSSAQIALNENGAAEAAPDAEGAATPSTDNRFKNLLS